MVARYIPQIGRTSTLFGVPTVSEGPPGDEVKTEDGEGIERAD
jgi:hypothetical protein